MDTLEQKAKNKRLQEQRKEDEEYRKSLEEQLEKSGIKKIEPYTTQWERMADNLARAMIEIKACNVCGHPVVSGYCCTTCNDVNP